jgi:hypothetical protein
MITTLSLRPPYSILIIEGQHDAALPTTLGGKVFVATDECIVVGCRSETDGEPTIVLLTDETWAVSAPIRFEAEISTPFYTVSLRSAEGETYVETPVSSIRTMVVVNCDDDYEPSRIEISLQASTVAER